MTPPRLTRLLRKTIVLTSISALVMVQSAAAQLAPESDEPLEFTSEKGETVDGVATLQGNVRVTQGEALLTTEKLTANFDDDGDVTTINAIGAVRYSNGKEAITGDTALYNARSRTITISGNVIATQKQQVLAGGTLVYWIDTGRTQLTAPEGRRIRGIFHTNSSGPKL